MRMMTFNIRFENPEDVENRWEARREQVCEIIRRYAPSIIGTQEGTWNQLIYLLNNLPEYTFHAPDRVIDDTCQYPTIYYHRKKFEVTGGGDRWLSKTPSVHRSKDWDSAFPRMMSYGMFRDQETGRKLLVIVTHLDHQGTEARQEQARLIASFVTRHTVPAVVMGDFNDRPGSRTHQILTGSDVALYDTWQLLGKNEGEESMTHHGFSGFPQKTRMDWILVSSHFRVTGAQVIRDHWDGQYPSDHFPYLVDLE